MSRIRILSDHLANQIAAGEVVERPASVVKELLENALDAGADRIVVQVEGGGTRLIRVMDNGMGMDEDDVLLCLERHATSKLRGEDELGAISTLGFRGEAIPSIGSVSRLTILSRPADQPTGTRAEVRYGTLHAVHEDGCARGTIVEVRNLFGNIPARKKFLKTNRTELFHIEEVIRNQALASPGVAFSLEVDSRPSFQYPAAADAESRMRAVFRYRGDLLELHGTEGEEDTLQLGGFLQLPESVSASTARLRLLVNRRPVQDRTLRHAVIEGLHGFLMKGRSPAGVVLLELSPEEVDVNVHPAKREIRFRDPRRIHRFVQAAVRGAVQEYQERMRGQLFGAPESPAGERMPRSDMESFTPRPIPLTSPDPVAPAQGEARQAPDEPIAAAALETPRPESILPESREPEPVNEPKQEETGRPEPFAGSGSELIGQLFNLYLLCEQEDHLLVIDQHAAHERILYGRLVQGYLDRSVASQSLLFPVSVELGPDHWELFEQHHEGLERLGLRAEPFGEGTCVIRAVPALLAGLAPADILVESLEALRGAGAGEGGVPAAVEGLFASMACKGAVRAGNPLRPEEMLGLLAQMEASEVFSHCPHGRPVVKRFSRRDIEQWFHRT